MLALSGKGLAYTVADEVDLRSGNALGIRSGYFEQLRVIDSGGALRRVTRVHGARLAAGEWLGRIFGRFVNPRMTVELELELERVLTLEEVKEEVRAGVRKIADVLDEGPGGARYVLWRVKRAKTLSELFVCFEGLV